MAIALMAKMDVDPKDRARVKFECYRLLVKLKLDPARLQMISGFIDAYLPLDPREQEQFQAQVDAGAPEEREVILELTNSWIEQGREEGRRGEATNLAIRLLKKRLDTLSPTQEATIRQLPIERLEDLVEAVFEIATPADLDARLKG